MPREAEGHAACPPATKPCLALQALHAADIMLTGRTRNDPGGRKELKTYWPTAQGDPGE